MHKLPLEFHPKALEEVLEATDRYRERSIRAADGFIQALERAHHDIQSMPDTWATYLHGTRRYLLSRYPYVIVYRVTESRIEVVAVANGHRKPGYWIDRVDPS